MTISSFSGEYAFLSNFYVAPIHVLGRVYNTNEHAFQAFKALTFEQRHGDVLASWADQV